MVANDGAVCDSSAKPELPDGGVVHQTWQRGSGLSSSHRSGLGAYKMDYVNYKAAFYVENRRLSTA